MKLVEQVNAYTMQIGTAFDDGQELIWTLIGEEGLSGDAIIVPRPRKYRKPLAKLALGFDGTPAGAVDLKRMLDQDGGADGNVQGAHLFLSVKELMQSAHNFCPDGMWFEGLGARAARYRGLFAPSKMQFMICLRSPALLLSDAISSGNYPAFEDAAPDPFALRWAHVLQDLRTHCPDAHITAWCAEEAPLIWKQVLLAATRADADLTVEAETRLACQLMNNEGCQRLVAYLERHPALPDHKRSRAIELFLEKFVPDGALDFDIAIPDWTAQDQEKMDAQYGTDLEQVSQMDGVTLIRA